MVLQLAHSSKSVYDDFRKLIREELRPRLRSELATAQGLLAEAAEGFGHCPVAHVDVAQHRLCRVEELRLQQLVCPGDKQGPVTVEERGLQGLGGHAEGGG